ncbi:MAG: ComEC/Rec2 family competence protein [Ilumatobacteraceae bacterium]
MAIGVATRSWIVVVASAVVVAVASGRARPVVLVVLVVGCAVVRSDAAWDGLAPDHVGPYHGWSNVAAEPQRYPGGTRVLLDIEGERHELWVRGRARQQRVADWRAGDQVLVDGRREPLDHDRAQRVAWQHVVASFDLTWVGDRLPGGRIAVASNRVRVLIERGASTLSPDLSALARGLIIGDDRDQPPEMVQRFRDSGLAHLTAVSGQNVAFLLAAAGPLLARTRPFTRWALSLALIAWFVVLTRAEPSVLRAGTMAALGATAYALGRPRDALRSLAVAVVALLLLDPLLAWSVGFWLSVGATAGVTGVGPHLAPRLRRLGPLATPVAITLGAQLGVAAPSLLVFGRLSLVGTLANLVAVPVAGLVMLYGLPACIVAGAVPATGPVVVAPVGWGTRWVDAVATVAARLEPPAPWSVIGWVVLVLTVAGVAVLGDRPGPLR